MYTKNLSEIMMITVSIHIEKYNFNCWEPLERNSIFALGTEKEHYFFAVRLAFSYQATY